MATSLPNPADNAAPPSEPVVAQPAQPALPALPAPPALFERKDAGEGKFEVRLNTGEIFTGTPDELVEKLAGSAAHTHNYGRQLKTELQSYKQQAQPASPIQAPPAVDPAEQMIADITARNMGFGNAAEMRQAVERMNSNQMEIQGRMVANQFMSENPDFGPSEHNSRVLTEILANNGMPETPQTLAMAHGWAKAQGMYEQVTPQPRGQQWQRPQPPPTLPQGSSPQGASGVSDADLRTMPMDKLAELYQRTKQ